MHENKPGTKYGVTNKHVIKSLVPGAAILLVLASTFSLCAPTSAQSSSVQQDQTKQRSSGTLWALSSAREKLGEFPLKRTSVDTKISGYVASVMVKQEFQNSYSKKIDAIYSFPLSDSGAVDKMTMDVRQRHHRLDTQMC